MGVPAGPAIRRRVHTGLGCSLRGCSCRCFGHGVRGSRIRPVVRRLAIGTGTSRLRLERATEGSIGRLHRPWRRRTLGGDARRGDVGSAVDGERVRRILAVCCRADRDERPSSLGHAGWSSRRRQVELAAPRGGGIRVRRVREESVAAGAAGTTTGILHAHFAVHLAAAGDRASATAYRRPARVVAGGEAASAARTLDGARLLRGLHHSPSVLLRRDLSIRRGKPCAHGCVSAGARTRITRVPQRTTCTRAARAACTHDHRGDPHHPACGHQASVPSARAGIKRRGASTVTRRFPRFFGSKLQGRRWVSKKVQSGSYAEGATKSGMA